MSPHQNRYHYFRHRRRMGRIYHVVVDEIDRNGSDKDLDDVEAVLHGCGVVCNFREKQIGET